MENGQVIRLGYGLDELSGEELLSLNYLWAVVGMIPENPDDASKYQRSVSQLREFKVVWDAHVKMVGAQTARQQLNTGYERLMEKGILEGMKRDGHRDWMIQPGVTVLHNEKLIDRQHLVERVGAHDGLLVIGENE